MPQYNTFWDLINNLGIEIPAIQRDYAHGRSSDQIDSIRSKFITAIFSALKDQRSLGLDFIYGKIHGLNNEAELQRNRQAIEALLSGIRDYATSLDLFLGDVSVRERHQLPGTSCYLVPLDGQQRLTTLFLVHWYLIMRTGKYGCLEALKCFRYRTRKSTEDFLNLLCNLRTLIFTSDLREELMGLEAFSNTWLNDPTVVSMLTVIQEIQTYCQNQSEDPDYAMYWRLLAESGLIHFDFLNLQDFNLSDDLYVKMNARGKQLSNFENFKAWLFGKIEHNNWYPPERWKESSEKFELTWNDLFWDNKDEDQFEIDTSYFNYFKTQYLLDLVKRADLSGIAFAEGPVKDVIDAIISGSPAFDFEKAFDAEFGARLPTYFAVLESCSQISEMTRSRHEIGAFMKFHFNRRGNTVWVDLIRNYIVLAYIEAQGHYHLDSDHFREYFRIVSNLFNNQTFDNAQLYKRAIMDIQSINAQIANSTICDWINDLDPGKNPYVFTDDQLAEEKHKVSLLETDVNDSALSWSELILRAESHHYFKGKIGFLIKLSDNDKLQFQWYYNKIARLIEKDCLGHPDYLFQRALLTCGNYFVGRDGGKLTFCKNDSTAYRDRRENWLQVLNDVDKIKLLQNLVDNPLFDEAHFEKSLIAIITSWIDANPLEILAKKGIDQIEYHHLYIHCPDLFSYGSSRLIKLHKNRYAFQLNSTSAGGNFNDVVSTFIKKTYFDDNESLISTEERGWNKSPELRYRDEVRVRLDPNQDCFIAEVEAGAEQRMISISEVRNFFNIRMRVGQRNSTLSEGAFL